jgi:methionyl aminopeptidase
MILKTDEEIEKIKESCLLVSKTLAEVAKHLKVGITGKELDKIAEAFILDHKAVPSFKGYRGFPATLCISPNYAVVHGIPNDVPFKDTDIVSIDCGVYFNGYHGDSAYTFAFVNAPKEAASLMTATKESLNKGIDLVKAGVRTGDLGFEIQDYCEKRGYSVVRELVGHGVGRNLHEPPDVPNFGKKGKGVMLKKNLVIAIEPMINMGKKEVVMDEDDWTIITKDKKLSAHFEHTICVGLEKSVALTTHKFVEEAVLNNNELLNI